MKYKLSEWEMNGYHDSDGYLAYWDDDENAVKCMMHWTTRFAGGPKLEGFAKELTSEVLEKSLDWLADAIFHALKIAEEGDVLRPQRVNEGDRVRLLEAHRNQAKYETYEECRKCAGTGKWVNPNDPLDVRKCFGCKGTGQRFVSSEKVKDENGKQVYEEFKPGVAGEVIWVGTFRTIYAKGANKRDRSTLSTVVRLDDGRKMRAPLDKLRLDREQLSDEELRKRAESLAPHCGFRQAFGYGGWDSKNWALAFSRGARVK